MKEWVREKEREKERERERERERGRGILFIMKWKRVSKCELLSDHWLPAHLFQEFVWIQDWNRSLSFSLSWNNLSCGGSVVRQTTRRPPSVWPHYLCVAFIFTWIGVFYWRQLPPCPLWHWRRVIYIYIYKYIKGTSSIKSTVKVWTWSRLFFNLMVILLKIFF